MKPFTEFLPYVLPFAPSVPEPLAIQYLRLAAITFCERSRAWREVQEIEVVGDDFEQIPIPSQAELLEIENVFYRQTTDTAWTKLPAKPYAEIDQSLFDSTVTDNSKPNIYSQIEQDSIFLLPRAQGVVRISAFFKPSPTAEIAPDILYTKYASIIADGALMHILMIPEQPYTNPNMGALKAGVFNSNCDAHFNLNMRGQQRAPARAKSSFM